MAKKFDLNQEIQDMVLDIIGQVDYDIVKQLDPELADCQEDPEGSAMFLSILEEIAHKYVTRIVENQKVNPELKKKSGTRAKSKK